MGEARTVALMLRKATGMERHWLTRGCHRLLHAAELEGWGCPKL